ncbi:protein disulfide-isomerase A6-like [Sipha flava]|uniref:Protein disulfide-isomerase A6-like n=1 Tax=Sipha flava TaxID=143950 RepID=A0A2S2Q6B8_9HEMI|nr:protein disulfide-isomerase A6-like [Sipha flava]
MNLLFCVSMIVLVCKCMADTFYESDSGVVELTDDNFNRTVLETDNVWLVKFYAPWCRYSKELRTEYSKAAKAMKGFANVGALNTDKHRIISKYYHIKEVPTVVIFIDKNNPTEFFGQSSSPAINITNAVIEAIKLNVSTKLNITSQESSILEKSSTLH